MRDETEEQYEEAIRQAREMSPAAVQCLISIMLDREVPYPDRIAAAEAILEISGCLSR